MWCGSMTTKKTTSVCGHGKLVTSVVMNDPERHCRPMSSRTHQRVTPWELSTHRLTHSCLNPGCICPARDPNQSRKFTESAIYKVRAGNPFEGEWVASCATDNCGYFGEFISLHKFSTHILTHNLSASIDWAHL